MTESHLGLDGEVRVLRNDVWRWEKPRPPCRIVGFDTPTMRVYMMYVRASAPEAEWWAAVRHGYRLGLSIWCET